MPLSQAEFEEASVGLMTETKPTHHILTKMLLGKLIFKVIKLNETILAHGCDRDSLTWSIIESISNNEVLMERIPYVGCVYMTHTNIQDKLIPRLMDIWKTYKSVLVGCISSTDNSVITTC